MSLKRETEVHSERANRLTLLRKVNFSAIESGLLYVAGATAMFAMLLTTSDVVGRHVFAHPIIGTVEITELLLVMIVYFAVSATEKAGTHISMSAIPELLKRKGKMSAYHALEAFNLFLPLCIFAFASYQFILETYNAYLTNEASFGPLYIRYWPLKLFIAIGFAFLASRMGITIIEHVKAIAANRRSLSS